MTATITRRPSIPEALRTPLRAGLLASAALGTLLAAHASTSAEPSLAERAQSPAQRLAVFQQQAKARAAAAQAAGAPDITAPTMSRFSVVGDVNAQAAVPHVNVDVTMTDDLSGLQTYIISLTGPSGQSVQRVETLSTGQLKVDGRLSVGAPGLDAPSFNAYAEPGTWTVNSVFLFDANFNGKGYFTEDLVAMGGRTSFTVKNGKGHDITPPTLTKGTVETPKLSLSTPPAGTGAGTPPYASVKISTTDAGNGVISGTHDAIVEFCLADQYLNCIDTIELHGRVGNVGQDTSTFRVGGQLRDNQTPGLYQLLNVYVSDMAQNASMVSSNKLGGSTDFSTLFAAGSTLRVTK